MRKYGLIGYPLSHSFSPGYFRNKFDEEQIPDARYDLYPIDKIEDFERIKNMSGLNVTIPYKEAVIPFLDELSPEAREIGAVNTICFKEKSKIGYNTDTYGFEHSLVPLWGVDRPESALVLGTGGAAKAVWFVLDKLGIKYLKVSRSSGDIQYQDIQPENLTATRLIINTTPLGMSPNIESCPELPYDALTKDHILYDLVYNPEKTLFLRHGLSRGATVKNGLEMLRLQAEKSWEIWNLT